MSRRRDDRLAAEVVEVAVGAEAGRRLAWAKFYEERERTEKLLELNSALELRLAELVTLIACNETLAVIEPEGLLIERARAIVAAMLLRPRGQAALRKCRETGGGS